MKLSYEWLKEYVDIGVSAEELAKGLTMSGSEVESIQNTGDDSVMSLEITSNRPDCLNIAGLAREASAVFEKDLVMPQINILKETVPEKEQGIECTIKNLKLCPRYTARVITDVNVSEANGRIKKRILSVGLRPVNNIVDITNFCLMELGQPLHAFDLDKIKGGKIIIREAVKGEKIVTIDGIERELAPGMLVIADAKRAVAIAGIFGGKDTEVTRDTKNILLESAYFDPISIRRTARRLGLTSDSSYRFERGVDKGMIKTASDRAADIICKEAGGKVSEFYDAGDIPVNKVLIEFSIENAEKILGISLKREKVKQIFQRLGITITKEDDTKLVVSIPTFREDLTKEIDLVEEVARIHGYDNIPAKVTKLVPEIERKGHSRRVKEKILDILSAAGLNEIMTYSLISEKAAHRFQAIAEGSSLSLINPISEELKVLTPQLLGGMLKAISWNINRKIEDLGFFEVGKIYTRLANSKTKFIPTPMHRCGDFIEIPTLCIALTGHLQKNWNEKNRPVNLYDLKGIAESMFTRLGIVPEFREVSIEGCLNCAEIILPDKSIKIGFLAEVDAKLLNEYDILQPVYISQIKLDKVAEKALLENRYHAVGRFPSAWRDISILCEESLVAEKLHKIILKAGKEIIRSVELVDLYEGDQIPKGKRSLSYSIEYGVDIRTLTDEEIERAHAQVKETLVKELGVSFR